MFLGEISVKNVKNDPQIPDVRKKLIRDILNKILAFVADMSVSNEVLPELGVMCGEIFNVIYSLLCLRRNLKNK